MGLPIFPVLLDNATPPLGFRSIQAADLTKWDCSTTSPLIQNIIRDLKKILDLPAEPESIKPALQPESKSSKPHSARLVVFIGVPIVVLVLLILGLWHFSGRQDQEYRNRLNSFLGALPRLKWIFYDPSEYDPYNKSFPSEDSLYKDLKTLHHYGFNGLITIRSEQSFSHVPRIAHEIGFSMVIAGVWDLHNQEELINAFKAAPYVDAYCLGHRGLNRRYTLEELEDCLKRFREETQRPVTTSEVLAEYETNARFLELGDFLFPDIHVLWQQGLGPREAWQQTLSLARQAARLLIHDPHKLILLKIVSYPSGGAKEFTLQSQKEFYRMAVEEKVSHVDIPARISFSYFAAFDPVWKTENQGWDPPERFIGLFTVQREPKPAVTEVDWGRYR
jgi:exo-beta-1,3-glucanase (GH17 family)